MAGLTDSRSIRQAAPPPPNRALPAAAEESPLLTSPAGVVLPTLNRDGSRRWLRPRVSTGRFLSARRIVAYVLIAIFTLVPHVRIGGKPLMQLNLAEREFTFVGKTFLPTDTPIIALFLLAVFVGVFLFTALLGRVWCGWGCPQTVYLEFVYRPLQRLFEGTPGRGGVPARSVPAWRTFALYAAYLIISMFLAHTFLAYFVGVDALAVWVRQSPLNHPTSFLIMAATTALMMFNFVFFREQTCILACPYGRIQSALLDRSSLIITYDEQRGEPRGKISAQDRGDCVDCNLCVTTCPTGIDIRRGLQMECIGCAQCIDTCDRVMDKLHRPRGLIRYSSQAALAGQRGRLLRARTIIYSLVLLIAISALAILLITKAPADVSLLRGPGLPYNELPDGTIAGPIRAKITNRSEHAAVYQLALEKPFGVTLRMESESLALKPAQTETLNGVLIAPRDLFHEGLAECEIRVSDDHGFQKTLAYKLLGPARAENEKPHDRD